MKQILCIIVAMIFGSLFYIMMSKSIPKEVNCSFSANIWTDIGAFIVGAILVYYGIQVYDNCVITMIGVIIITEHLWQLGDHKIA
jgi:Na+/H+ antiporter NhaD/arsenite permease-like protein